MASYLPYAAPPIPQFRPPDPNTLSATGQFRLSQGQKALERGAAARGTLLTGGLQARLLEHGQGVASEEAGNDYQRALSTYLANRDTDQINVGRAQTNALSLAAPAAPPVSASPIVDPQAAYHEMLRQRQDRERDARIADERRSQFDRERDNFVLSGRQLADAEARRVEEARTEAARVAENAALAQRQLAWNRAAPAPTAAPHASTGYEDMRAQYERWLQQVAANEQFQRAGSERQNAMTNAPAELAMTDTRRRMMAAEEDARLSRQSMPLSAGARGRGVAA